MYHVEMRVYHGPGMWERGCEVRRLKVVTRAQESKIPRRAIRDVVNGFDNIECEIWSSMVVLYLTSQQTYNS